MMRWLAALLVCACTLAACAVTDIKSGEGAGNAFHKEQGVKRIKFEPIEGNGWYVLERRVPPPAAFFVEASSLDAESFEGTVSDPISEFRGYSFRAHQTFVEDRSRLTIRLYRGELPKDVSIEPEISGYVRLVE